MTPPDIAALTAIAAIVKQIGAWPMITTFLFLAIGPWIGVWWSTSINKERHAAVVDMYTDNVTLVKSFESIAKSLQDVVILNTQAMQGVKESVDNNIYCPIMRKDPKIERII
jgi:hypothetical protein